MNNTLKELAEIIKSKDNVLLFPHVNPDGDAIGATTALCRTIRLLGKNCYILTDEELPDNLKFLDEGFCVQDKGIISKPNLAIAVDCGDIMRFESRKEVFFNADETMCIDHHLVRDVFCDYNYIDPKAPATCQIIFYLIKEIGIERDEKIGQSIYTGIMTDTGSFKYSNTDIDSYLIAAKLLEWGVKQDYISNEIYENDSIEKIKLESMILNTLKMIDDGKAVVAYVDGDMLKRSGAGIDDADSVVAKLRSIKGIEVAILLKEYGQNEIKVSLRSKNDINVAEFAGRFGGGGHVKAAGFTINNNMQKALKIIEDEISKYLNETSFYITK